MPLCAILWISRSLPLHYPVDDTARAAIPRASRSTTVEVELVFAHGLRQSLATLPSTSFDVHQVSASECFWVPLSTSEYLRVEYLRTLRQSTSGLLLVATS